LARTHVATVILPPERMIRAVREWEPWEYGRRLRWHGASTSRGQGTASSMPHCRCEIYVPPLLGEGLCSGALRRAEVDSIRAGSDDEEEEGADACGLPWDYTDLRNNAYEKKNCAGEEEDVSTNDLCDPDGRCSHPCPPRCCDRRMVAVAPPWHRDERRAAAAVDDAAVARRGEEADDDDDVVEAAAADRGGRSRHWGEEYSAGTDTQGGIFGGYGYATALDTAALWAGWCGCGGTGCCCCCCCATFQYLGGPV